MSSPGTDMNCEAFKEAVGADPQSFVDGAEHARQCESCAAYLAEMQRLDALIGRALAIGVPDLTMPGLPPVEGDNVVELADRRSVRGRAPLWLGLAASAAIAAIIGLQLGGDEPASDVSLANQILAHIDHEPGALRVTNVAVSEDRLNRIINPTVGTLDRGVGLITYAQSCVINGKTIPHLVIQGKKGPVTLLLMPDEMVDGVVPIEGDSVNGVILPVGQGSIAIVGERDEALGEIEKKVIDSVEWSI